MCAFWLRARSNHRGTNICVAIFSIRRNESRWSPSTLRISFYGVRFFFEHVLPRDWMSLALLDTRREQRLPAVLSFDELRAVLAAVHSPHHQRPGSVP